MSRKKKDKSAQSTRQLMGIDSVKDYCIATRMGDLVFFIIKPTNISVLPDSSISARIYALLNVVKGQAEIEMLALNSKESFERNKTFYQERQTCEELPAIRRLLEQDSTHLDRIQVLMASSREFYIIIRLRKEKDMRIPVDHFRWYAAFHNEGHHPHIHMMVWSDNPKEGFLTREGIAAMRSKLTNTIFRDEMNQIYERKDVAYKDLVETAQDTMRELIHRMNHQLCDNPVIEEQMRQLVQALETTTGKKQYGYLKKPLKALVDTIVDELSRQPEVAQCYEIWNQIRDELNECYGSRTPREHLPLSQQREFRRIKNDIIREAENIRLGLPTFEDEALQDEPEPEEAQEEHRSTSVYDQAQRYRAAKSVLQDVYALDEEHAEAVRELEQLWAEGYTVAAHQLGKFYRDDLSTMRDHEKAERWFRLSAEAGNDFSEYALGKLLLSQKRTAEALRWLDKAAGHGNQFAQYRLGKLYLAGESVKKDVRKALEYLTAAAEQGNSFAQYTLGKLYLLGRDVEQDREQAREWFTRSAAQGNQYAQFFLDRFDQFRDPSVMLAATKLLHHMSRIFRDNSVPPHNPAGIRIDSKRRTRLMEKRMAIGHKADDHEEQVSYQQTM